MTTEDIVTNSLSRVAGVHNHLQTWAVHDGQVCVYLAVTEAERIYAGVFVCRQAQADSGDCPWLGSCETDPYGRRVAKPIYDAAQASGWDETVIYGLLEQLHAAEVTR